MQIEVCALSKVMGALFLAVEFFKCKLSLLWDHKQAFISLLPLCSDGSTTVGGRNLN